MGKGAKNGIFSKNRLKTPLFWDFLYFFGHFRKVYGRDMEKLKHTPPPLICLTIFSSNQNKKMLIFKIVMFILWRVGGFKKSKFGPSKAFINALKSTFTFFICTKYTLKWPFSNINWSTTLWVLNIIKFRLKISVD